MEYRNKNVAWISTNLPNTKIIEEGLNYINYYDIISKLAEIFSKELI